MSRLNVVAGLVAAACAWASPLASCANQLTLTVTNELSIARPAETIAVPWQSIVRALPGVMLQKLAVKDAAGHVLPYQVVNLDLAAKDPQHLGLGFGDLLFQHDFAAGEKSASFTIEKTDSIAPPFPSRTYARYVPERYDDFAWENDKIAHRTYGPALAAPDVGHTGKEVLVTSGIDIWTKRVGYPIVDRWYNKGSYHRDDGEGMDMYHVGDSRGTGGTGIWDGRKLHTSANFQSWKIIANGPIRTIFELGFAAWDVDGRKVSELKRYTVDAGHNLDRIDSVFSFDGGKDIMVGIGINKFGAEKDQHLTTEALRRDGQHALVQWEAMKSNGALGEAVIVPDDFAGFAEDESNQLILAKASSGRAIRYYAGAGWTRGGDFPDKQAWLAYVAAEAARAASPVKVTLSAQ